MGTMSFEAPRTHRSGKYRTPICEVSGSRIQVIAHTSYGWKDGLRFARRFSIARRTFVGGFDSFRRKAAPRLREIFEKDLDELPKALVEKLEELRLAELKLLARRQPDNLVFAPGQRKEEGSSAKEMSPGHLKDNSASRSDEKSGLERKSENSEGLKNKSSDRNAKNRTTVAWRRGPKPRKGEI